MKADFEDLTPDLHASLALLERGTLPEPFAAKDFHRLMRRKGVRGRVAMHGSVPNGFIVWQDGCTRFTDATRATDIDIIRIVVTYGLQREGIGSLLMQDMHAMVGSLSRIVAATADDALGHQLFLRHNGYRCYGIRQGRYLFERPAAAVANRVKQYFEASNG